MKYLIPRLFRSLVGAIVAALLLTGCSNIDCPLDNVVALQVNLYDATTREALTLSDVLTIKPAGRDTLLLNQATNLSSFLLPLKEAGGTDTLVCSFANADGQEAQDTLFIAHTPHPHFEAVDCPACVFHTVTAARVTSHSLTLMPLTLDSVSIVRPEVNYDDAENLRLFLRTADH